MGTKSGVDKFVRQFQIERSGIESHIVTSYSFAPEIFKYFKGVAEKYELYKYIRLSHMITGATWDESSSLWKLKIKNLESGELFDDWCDFLVNGSGILKFVHLIRQVKCILTIGATGNGQTSQAFTLSRVHLCIAQLGKTIITSRAKRLLYWDVDLQVCK